MRSILSIAGAATLAAFAAAPLAAQKAPTPRPDARGETPEARARTLTLRMGDDEQSDRPLIGVSTSSSGDRDTLGVLVVQVTPGGPADKAGIEEGDRLAAVNGVNLRLAAADAGENDMNGLTTRRLSREIGKVKAGAEVELRVWSGGQFRNVKVKTVAASEMPGRTVRWTRSDVEGRGVMGLTLGNGGSRRDTLGVLVSRVESDGPAEKAGIVEGDRIVSVNGTDLRVAREDAGDDWMSNAKTSRFTRALRDLKAGDKVTLRVWSGGQTKTVEVTAARNADVYKNNRGGVFFGGMGEGGMPMIAPMPPMAPMGPMPPMAAPRVRILRGGNGNVDIDDDDMSFNFNFDANAFRGLGDELRNQMERALDGVGRAGGAVQQFVARRHMTSI